LRCTVVEAPQRLTNDHASRPTNRDMETTWSQLDAGRLNQKFLQKFRVTKPTFEWLFGTVGPSLTREDTPMRAAIPARKRFAITMNYLSKGTQFDELADAWGVAKSTVHGIVHDTVSAMRERLLHNSVCMPSSVPAILEVIQGFEAEIGMPQCVGAIDGSFIPMGRPCGPWAFQYWCYKHNNFAILLNAIVDVRGKFMWIKAGETATKSDSMSFRESRLFHDLDSGRMLPPTPELTRDIGGMQVRPFLVADSAFLFNDFTMKGYPGKPARGTPQAAYNECHVRTRRVVENAFGRLKGRFRCLTVARIRDPKFMTLLTEVCVALHNICTNMNDECEPSWFYTETAGPQPSQAGGLDSNNPCGSVRDALAQHLHGLGYGR